MTRTGRVGICSEMISALKASIIAVGFGTVVRNGTGCRASHDIYSTCVSVARLYLAHTVARQYAPAHGTAMRGHTVA